MKRFSPIFPASEKTAGVYVHIPFCLSRCHYCAFVTNRYDEGLETPYVKSVEREAEIRSADIPVDTIYLGGGTPSLLRPTSIQKILETCRQRFLVTASPEITVEINPGAISRYYLAELRSLGVNRASLGVQSFEDHELACLGRSHKASDAGAAFKDLRNSGFDNISVDLIAGYPGQSLESMRKTLRQTISLGPDHVSVYLLELKPGTRLHTRITSGATEKPDDDLAADLYEETCSLLSASGYEHYEISNFAREGRLSRHNLKYWEDSPYIGLGAGAHGMTGRVRYANLEDLRQYQNEVNQEKLPVATLTELTPETRFKEALIMGLRLVRGVDLEHMSRRYLVDVKAFVADTVGDLSHAGLVALDGEILSLTPRGRLLSNVVFSRWV
jgi:oxygen-independent coproporphyrinogen-3 oxidase